MTTLYRINDTLYKSVKSNLYFIMERLVIGKQPETDFSTGRIIFPEIPERIKFWQKFVNEQNYYLRKYVSLYYEMIENKEEFPQKYGFITPERRGSNVVAGLSMFNDVINDYTKHRELWVAFISTSDINKIKDIIIENIEMYVSIITDSDIPITTHMGINKSTQYLYNALVSWRENKINILHRNLSIDLHSFAAKVITSIYNDKIYMITAPAPEMATILDKSFPDDIYKGSNSSNIMHVIGWDNYKNVEYVSALISNSLMYSIGNMKTSPILMTASHFYNSSEGILYILDQTHTNIILMKNYDRKEISLPLKNKILIGEDFKRFYWFDRYVYGQPVTIATISLDILASKF